MIELKGHQRGNLVIGSTRAYMVCHSTLKTLKKNLVRKGISPIERDVRSD